MKRLFTSICFTGSVLIAGAQFTNNGNMKMFAGTNIAFYGDVTNNGTLVDSGNVVTMAGSGQQTIGGTSVTTLKNVTVNNTSATGITLSQNLVVRGALTLTDGYVNTSSSALLTLTGTATTSGASSASFVSGPMVKTGNQAFTFPVGKDNAFAPFAISAPALITDQFSAEYFKANPNPVYSVTSKDVTLDHVSQCEYWMLNQVTGTSSINVTLSWDTHSCGVNYVPDLRIARWDGTQWKDHGNGGTTGTTASGTIITPTALNTFGAFTLASISGNNVLPIELTYFSGSCENSGVVLNWSTASEINNDYFTIERSTDAQTWEVVSTMHAAGNSSSETDYSYTDETRLPGQVSYYRLQQTDIDGTQKDLKLISVNGCPDEVAGNSLHIYPNPSRGAFNLQFSATPDEVQSIQVFNMQGESIPVDVSNTQQLDLTGQPAGIYLVVVNVNGTLIKERITLE